MLLPLLPIILLLPLSTRDVEGNNVAALAVAASAASCRRRCRRRRHCRRRCHVGAAVVDVGWQRHRIRVSSLPDALARHEDQTENILGALHHVHGTAISDSAYDSSALSGADLGGLPLLRGRPLPPSHLPTAKATTASVVSSNGTFLGENREKTSIICGGRRRRVAAAAAGGCTQ